MIIIIIVLSLHHFVSLKRIYKRNDSYDWLILCSFDSKRKKSSLFDVEQNKDKFNLDDKKKHFYHY